MKKIFESVLKIFNEHPARAFGLLYPFILTLIIVTGLFYLTKVNVLSRHTVMPVLVDTAVVADLLTAEGKINPPVDILKVSKPDADILAKGKTLFSANCASCHGEGGNGDGAGGATLNPKPRNFHATDGWKNGRKIVEIYKTLQEGIKGSGMSAYDYLPPVDRFALLHYVRSFMTSAPTDSPAELTALDNTYSLSKGSKLAGQIPVTVAETITLNENKSSMDFVKQTITQIEKDSSDSAQLFKKITNKKNNAINTLKNSKLWHQNQQEFVKLITENIPVNGFNGNTHSLSSDELSAVQSYLKKYFND